MERVVVPFAGNGSGTGELSWGQLEFWLAIRRLGGWLPMGGVAPLPAGTTVRDIRAHLRYLMERYPPLRTTFVLDGDPDRPRQVVHGKGRAVLEVVDDEDPADVHRRFEATPLDFTTEWPIRMAVVRHGDTATHLVVAISHLATDAHGARVMLRESAVRDRTPVSGMQPLEQALWQQSAAGRRQNTAALRHFESLLRTVPPRRFPVSRAVQQQPAWAGEFASSAMLTAVPAIARRTGANPSTILLAVFAVALHRVTGINPVVVRPLVNNRFRPNLADVVCTAAQSGLCVLDVAGVPFGTVLDRVNRAAMTTYKHAYHDPVDFADLLRKVSAERGVDIELTCYFNNRRVEELPPDAAPPVPSRSEVRWTPTDQGAIDRLFVRVEPDEPGTMRLGTLVDTNLLSLADTVTCLRTMESVAVEAAHPGVTLRA